MSCYQHRGPQWKYESLVFVLSLVLMCMSWLIYSHVYFKCLNNTCCFKYPCNKKPYFFYSEKNLSIYKHTIKQIPLIKISKYRICFTTVCKLIYRKFVIWIYLVYKLYSLLHFVSYQYIKPILINELFKELLLYLCRI
jgi:hypothetical protein